MKIRTLLLCAALCPAAGPAPVLADGDVEMLEAHAMPLYPGSVEEKDGEKLNRLTKDDLASVRKYFEARLKPGDRIEDFSGDGEAGFRVIYARKVGKRELTAQEVSAAARTDKRPPHNAFGELNAQVSMGRHGRAELDALLREYGDIDAAYYRAARGARARDEYGLLEERAFAEAHPDADKLKAAGKRGKVSAGDKAAAQDLKRRMQELKKQGDIAGMMALAQSRNQFQAPPAGMAGAAKTAADDLARDTWDVWVKCLKDTKAAAYRVRIDYAAAALP